MAISRFDLTQPPSPRMSRCVVRDNTVYLAGLTASDATQDIKGQTKQILDKIDGYLAQAGTSKSNLLSANLWIKDMALFADMNSVWNAWVDPENPPARLRESRHGAPGDPRRNHGDRRQVTRRDCFAEPVLGPRGARTRGIAMTALFVVIARRAAPQQSRRPVRPATSSRSRHRRRARPRAPESTG
jgi:hypothetical protein